MSLLETVAMIAVILGVILFFVSFSNVEMITGLWVAGDIDRDEEFIKAGQFRKRIYWILRILAVVIFAVGVLLMQVD
ncbi:MAG: hypothetical protein JW929_05290 [Anaerolineales bacterium]|nr:hypothetical protein [Anaerolineales bacterium]